MTIRVRFAPSPTGYLHIGGARTALFNWLFARNKKGVFVLRIEDTDEARSTEESTAQILRSMEWLGMNWDEGPFLQSDHKAKHQQYAAQLVRQGRAYQCYCSPEELETRRKEMMAKKLPPKYNGQCRALSAEQKKKFEQEGRQPVIRFRMPDSGVTKINDLVKGPIQFDNSLLDDFVILKSSGVPVYNFAVVCDDHDMAITHVIRGDDHISNTPRQIMLYQAFGWELPEFAHIPMILGPDGARLSKRHGAAALDEYIQQGYLPEAIMNYLVLLGWATEDSQQIFSVSEMIEKFSLERCAKNAAIFDPEKLKWLNGEYIRHKLLPENLVRLGKKFLVEKKLIDENTDLEYINQVISLERERIKTIGELPELVDFFFMEKVELADDKAQKTLAKPNVKEILAKVAAGLSSAQDFSVAGLEQTVRQLCETNNYKTGEVFHPVRVAVSGRTTGPGLFDMLSVLGRERVLARIKQTVERL
ncbi:MAG: glutamate--tRNA ligase [bacterium]|nr:glutamate--tRNA ligase [bacterium]MDD5353768.1 glutamate--tRNA ligase [bacterium]MDD5756313.1 glutamate--tRNA ligase [bacterium]